MYEDIIDLPHHVSATRPHMTMPDRAAQFSPFAALTGYGDAVNETARRTDSRIELDEYEKAALNERLQVIADNLRCAEISVTYFLPDIKKSGGKYITLTGCVKKIDDYERVIVMQSNTRIPIDDIVAIDGELFCGWQ